MGKGMSLPNWWNRRKQRGKKSASEPKQKDKGMTSLSESKNVVSANEIVPQTAVQPNEIDPEKEKLKGELADILQEKINDAPIKLNKKDGLFHFVNDLNIHYGVLHHSPTIFFISTDGEKYQLLADLRPSLFTKDELLFLVNELEKRDDTKGIYIQKVSLSEEQREKIKKARIARKEQAQSQPSSVPSQTAVRSLQGVLQDERAPNELLGDFPTATFEKISNTFGDVHTIGYGGSGATFLASLGAYEFLGLIGFLFFFALFVMKGIRACRKKKQWKAAESETESFQNEVEQDDTGGYEVGEMGDMV